MRKREISWQSASFGGETKKFEDRKEEKSKVLYVKVLTFFHEKILAAIFTALRDFHPLMFAAPLSWCKL